mmetsp:Transcript_22509/g.32900  ORF Transcript_22509/g.32900 Transcript_22509/m.32900 type:complete len:83 (+) Transcript_22509:2323-2571(+)
MEVLKLATTSRADFGTNADFFVFQNHKCYCVLFGKNLILFCMGFQNFVVNEMDSVNMTPYHEILGFAQCTKMTCNGCLDPLF